MGGKNLVLDTTTFTGSSLKYLRDDEILPVQGAMLLVDPTHPAAPWSAGIPADGSYIPNIAEKQLSSLLGTSDTTILRPKAVMPAGFTGAVGKIERTGKGGLHGIPSQVNGNTAHTPFIHWSRPLVQYLMLHPTNDFYFSLWAMHTRYPTVGSDTWASSAVGQQQTNSCNATLYPGTSNATTGIRPAAGTQWNLGYRAAEPGKDTGSQTVLNVPAFRNVGVADWYGSVPALDGTGGVSGGEGAAGGLAFGPNGAAPAIAKDGISASQTFRNLSAANVNQASSHIFYRLYLEDLTVSGRTYAQVDAIDFAMWKKECTQAGGRFYGDTYTDPATLP